MIFAEPFRGVEGILFDLDYTLVNFGKMKRAAINRAVNDMVGAGLPMSVGAAKTQVYMIYKKHGIEYQRVFNDLLEGLSLSKTDRNRILAAGIHGYREARRGTLTTYPGTIPTILELSKRGYEMGVISDATEIEAWLRIYDTGLGPFFRTVVTFDEDGIRKPNEKTFRKALKEFGLDAAKVVMIGDNPATDLAARQVGMKAIWATYDLETVSGLDDAERIVFYDVGNGVDSRQIADAEVKSLPELLFLLPGKNNI